MKKSLLISAAIHLLLLLGLPSISATSQETLHTSKQGDSSGLGKGSGQILQMKIIPKVKEVSALPKLNRKYVLEKYFSRKKARQCKKYFGGIGITWDQNSKVIDIVHPEYAAAKSGCVESGDIIMDVESDTGMIQGDEGKLITLVLVRGGIRVRCDLVRERICYE